MHSSHHSRDFSTRLAITLCFVMCAVTSLHKELNQTTPKKIRELVMPLPGPQPGTYKERKHDTDCR
jgi:hypothetical protein